MCSHDADLNFRILFELYYPFDIRFIDSRGGVYYQCRKNIGAHQLHSCCVADLRLCFFIYAKMQICHDEDHRSFDYTKGVKLYGHLG